MKKILEGLLKFTVITGAGLLAIGAIVTYKETGEWGKPNLSYISAGINIAKTVAGKTNIPEIQIEKENADPADFQLPILSAQIPATVEKGSSEAKGRDKGCVESSVSSSRTVTEAQYSRLVSSLMAKKLAGDGDKMTLAEVVEIFGNAYCSLPPVSAEADKTISRFIWIPDSSFQSKLALNGKNRIVIAFQEDVMQEYGVE